MWTWRGRLEGYIWFFQGEFWGAKFSKNFSKKDDPMLTWQDPDFRCWGSNRRIQKTLNNECIRELDYYIFHEENGREIEKLYRVIEEIEKQKTENDY